MNIDSELFYRMLISAANCIEKHKASINSLNVFPVPDGDTGTNMSMTIASAVKEVKGLKNRTIESVMEAAANGSLMGARGNSGVILSQLLRGFAKGVKGKRILFKDDIAFALKEGQNTAYKAVMKPTEGTILTVARECADKAAELAKSDVDLIAFMDAIFEYGNQVLSKTPEMLPVLKKAGVVDAGGKGLLSLYEGILSAAKGIDVYAQETGEPQEAYPEERAQKFIPEEDIKFGYCTEFIVKTQYDDIDSVKSTLSKIGDSLVVVGGAGIIKVHVHTNNPGDVLNYALGLGELTRIKIDNMREQHRAILDISPEYVAGNENSVSQVDGPLQKSAIITVAMGDGLRDIFVDLGASRVIEGGQTMNPSTEDILNAINGVNAEDIYVLPNNGNIVLAANQAATLTDKNVHVVPTKTVPQGIAALTAFNPDLGSEENIASMTSMMKGVKTGQVTYAVRDTNFDDKVIKEGNILGIADGKINNVGVDVLEVAESLVKSMVNGESELITVFYGKDTSEEETKGLVDKLEKEYTGCSVQSYRGGQPLYYYIISVE